MRTCLAISVAFALVLRTAAPAIAAMSAQSAETLSFFEQEAEVVIAASKHEQSTANAPASVTVVGAKEIEEHGFRTLAEILQHAANIYTIDDRNYDYHWVRGFGRPGDYNTRLLLLINGHRTNENFYGGSYLDHIFPVDVKMIKRVEVVKGPGSALYGNNAFLAVINVVTKDAADLAPVQTNLEAGSFGTAHGFAAGSYERADGGLVVSVSGTAAKGQDHTYGEFAAVNSGVADDSDAESDVDAFTSFRDGGLFMQAAFGRRRKEIPTGSYATKFNSDPASHSVDERGFVEAKYERAVTPHVSMSGRAYLDRYYYRGTYRYDGAIPPAVEDYVDFNNDTFAGEEVMVRLQTADGLNALTLGQDYEDDFRTDYVASYAGVEAMRIEEDAKRYSFFAQGELTPVRKLHLNLGGRYDRYATFKGTLNPRMAAVFEMTEATTIKALYGTAFRAPSAYERLYGTGLTAKPSPALRPEIVETAEAHVIRKLRPGASVSVGYFHSNIRRLIGEVLDPADGLIQFQNGAPVRSHGVEVSGTWRIGHTKGRLAYTGQETREKDGATLSNSPKHVGSLGLSRSFGPRLTAAYDFFVLSHRRTFQGTRLGTANTSNANLSYEATPRCRLYLGAFNLFNEDIRQSGGAEHQQAAIRQNGREFNGGVEVRFGR